MMGHGTKLLRETTPCGWILRPWQCLSPWVWRISSANSAVIRAPHGTVLLRVTPAASLAPMERVSDMINEFLCLAAYDDGQVNFHFH